MAHPDLDHLHPPVGQNPPVRQLGQIRRCGHDAVRAHDRFPDQRVGSRMILPAVVHRDHHPKRLVAVRKHIGEDFVLPAVLSGDVEVPSRFRTVGYIS
ncbi:hypothetical protein Ppa06_61560 [Planomonospora parontospora subsp. parontospora]|uniref:Uncharacterized protein n=1 Tax=Planomonospora parontospora subsp. parontospora TaxID=97194 RepID=A0ABQ4HJS3_9ACTN|nr:hypothetical protein Ppa06_61560 [Planomonospora parontospora subsp. parontospora]